MAALQFDVAGYLLEGADYLSELRPVQSVFFIDTPGNAVLDVEINAIFDGDILIKRGAGALTLRDRIIFFDQMGVSEGELMLEQGFSTFGLDFLELADNPSVVLTVGRFDSAGVSIPGLQGGGLSGGVVRPGTGAGTVNLKVESHDTQFSGRIEDSGSDILAVEYATNLGSQTLLNPNQYTGSTRVTGARGLVLSGNGSLTPSPITIEWGSQLLLDNGTSALSDRVSDRLPITMLGARLTLSGHAAHPVEEQFGALILSGSCTIETVRAGGPSSRIVFADLSQTLPGTLDVVGDGEVLIASWTNLSGQVNPYVTSGGTNWTQIDHRGALLPLQSYLTDLSVGTATDHVWITEEETHTVLDSDRAIGTLRLENVSGSSAILNLDGHTLDLVGGGLLSHGATDWRVKSGTVTATSSTTQLVLHCQNDLHMAATLLDAGSGLSLVKGGTGHLYLEGTNTYQGDTYVTEGSLHLTGDNQLGIGSRLVLNGGTVVFDQDFISAKELAADNNKYARPVDTNGRHVQFNSASGLLSKRGAGTLMISSGVIESFILQEGLLRLPGASGGTVRLLGGTLNATGHLDNVFVSFNHVSKPVISMGDGLGTLTCDTLFQSDSAVFLFDVDGAISDQLIVNGFARFGPFSSSPSRIRFREAGPISLGTPIVLIRLGVTSPLFASQFELDPGLRFNGWDATFTVQSNELRAVITSTGPNTNPRPDGLRLVGATPTSVTLAWNDNAATEEAYHVERATYSTWSVVTSLPPNTVVYRDQGLSSFSTYRYRVRAGNIHGFTDYSDEVVATPPDQPSEWRLLLFGSSANTGEGANTSDPDGDGTLNLMELALGTSPWIADRDRGPVGTITTDGDGRHRFGITFTRPTGYRYYAGSPGIGYLLERTDDLVGTWILVPSPVHSVTNQGDGTESLTITNPNPLGPTGPTSEFLRLQIIEHDYLFP